MAKSVNIKKLNSDFEKKSPEEILVWAVSEFGTDIAFASSFSAEDAVVIEK